MKNARIGVRRICLILFDYFDFRIRGARHDVPSVGVQCGDFGLMPVIVLNLIEGVQRPHANGSIARGAHEIRSAGRVGTDRAEAVHGGFVMAGRVETAILSNVPDLRK